MTEQEIYNNCKKYNIINYSINPDGSIDVDGNVDLMRFDFEKIPLKFNKVNGDFICSSCFNLTTLEGSPKYVNGDFYCSLNKLTSLEGCPKEIGGSFDCSNNKLKTLDHSPIVGGHFYCDNNPLESLKGLNITINKLFYSNKEKLIRKTKLKIIEKL